MKNFRLLNFLFLSFLAVSFASSCSSPKQVFYFQPGPATPKVAKPQPAPEPVFTASTATAPVNLPVINFPALAQTAAPEKAPVKTLSKKEVRQLIKQARQIVKDTINTRNRDRNRVSVSADKDRLARIEAEAREVKESVRVQNTDNKVVVDVKKPSTNLSSTELILVGVAALLILLILLSLPVLGNILGAILGIALIAAAVAILLGYIEINI